MQSRFVYPAMALVMTLLAIPLWWIASVEAPWTGIGPMELVIAVLLAGIFLCCEQFPLRIEVRRETMLISLTEIPLVIGLLWVPAPLVGGASLVTALLVYLFRRDNWRFLVLNLAFIAAESGVAAAVYTSVAAITPSLGWRMLALLVGVPLGALLSCWGVGITHRLIGPAEPISRVLLRAIVASGATTTFTLVGHQLWVSGSTGKVLSAGLAVAMVVLYRTYAAFLRQHLDLSKMYSFGRRVAAAKDDPADWSELLEQVRDQLNAQVAMIHLTEGMRGFETLAVGPDGPLTEPAPPQDDPILTHTAAVGRAHVSAEHAQDPRLLAALQARRANDVLAVPLRSGDRDCGFLEVRDRRSRWGRFSASDLRLLETLGGHLASALDNLRLLETLRHEAHHDAITGLLNWRGLVFRTETALAERSTSAAVLIQLGILSEVNNAIGYDRGEQLLSAVGARLAQELGPQATIAHLESDRFAVLLGAMSDADAELAVRDLIELVGASYALGGVEVEPNLRAGLAFACGEEVDGSGDSDVLWQRAEMALTAALAADEPLRVYSASMGQVFLRRFQLVTQFRRAVHQGAVTVQFQPKVSIADQELVGVEALVRWNHPEFGMVSPAEFVEAIEATGSIDILFEHVLSEVLAQIARWDVRRLRIPVAVNLSMRNLSSPDFPAVVARALREHKVAPERLTFEITESSVMADPGRSMPVLRELHAMGIRLSVDDFGTGYSSLAYLRRLPIDEIKIDRSFVQGMTTDLGDLAIVRAIIDLGHSLGLRMVAEGVEDTAARDALKGLRCDDMQGFLISRALPIDKLEAWLISRTVVVRQGGLADSVLRLTS